MHIDFKALTIDLTPEIRSYATSKVEMLTKLLQNVDEENIQFEVALERNQSQKTGEVFRADITVHAGGEKTHAVGHGETVEAAIDEAKDELTRRLRRGKGKRLAALREGGARIKKMMRFWE